MLCASFFELWAYHFAHFHCNIVLVAQTTSIVHRHTRRSSSLLSVSLKKGPAKVQNLHCHLWNCQCRRWRGKCFLIKGWHVSMNCSIAPWEKNWKTYWNKLRTEHKQLFELLQCIGIKYLSDTGKIVAPEQWWKARLRYRVVFPEDYPTNTLLCFWNVHQQYFHSKSTSHFIHAFVRVQKLLDLCCE